ncbi:hypothetical protein D7V64_17295 [Acinetobacter cumulans]|jgi:hypothetical protein|uniref:Head decoration protein n=1 Tax=Acinetobacter cumulans TaxID=2136182 RepID=A0A3A8FKU4_9GAMM|nr:MULTISPECIES: hypothetical protein [Acinetobacter]NWK73782.1 hypothetical protein [Acinetobacter sp. SwsAc6]RKG46979.1 hypothetical protein D7V64_17295 [Acinetobacter cumulans]
MGTITQTITTTQLVVGDGVRTENAKVKTATAYKRGDLLKVGTGNLADHPVITEGVVGDWNAIANTDMTAEQATYHAANGLEMPIYVQGAFDIAVVTVKGTALTAGQYDAVRAQALVNKIELRKVVGN